MIVDIILIFLCRIAYGFVIIRILCGIVIGIVLFSIVFGAGRGSRGLISRGWVSCGVRVVFLVILVRLAVSAISTRTCSSITIATGYSVSGIHSSWTVITSRGATTSSSSTPVSYPLSADSPPPASHKPTPTHVYTSQTDPVPPPTNNHTHTSFV